MITVGTFGGQVGTSIVVSTLSTTSKLIAIVGNHQGTVTSVKLNGVNLTLAINAHTTFNETSEIWYIDTPGTLTDVSLVATFSGGSGRTIGYINLEGSSLGAPSVTAASSTSASGASPSLNILPSEDNSIVIGGIYAEATISQGAGETNIFNASNSSFENGAGSYVIQTTAATQAVNFSLASGQRYALCAVAIRKGATPTTSTFTAQARVVNPTVRFTAQARVKVATTATFTARAWIRKNVKGGLADLQYRGMDMMKWTKDTITGQPSDTSIANLVSVVANNFNLTHIAIAVPIDPVAWYPSGFTPSPRTLPNFYKAWTDAIHATGLRVLHRGASFAMEGVSGFLHRVGGNRYPAGTYADVVPQTFTDNFNRAQVETSITQSVSTFTDNFNRTSGIGTTNWRLPIGSWSIVSNELNSTGLSNATNNIIITQATYTDFTVQAKIKKVSSTGFSGLVFRMRQDQNLFPGRGYANFFGGYVVQLRDGATLRLEDIATANLAQVTKTWTVGTYYQVKVVVTGANFKIRVWEDGTEEPSTYDIDYTDPQNRFTSGSVGFCSENPTTTTVFDDLTLTFSPTTNVVSDWNKIGTGWITESNRLKNITASAHWANVLYSKASYSNFVYTAKIQSLNTGQSGSMGMIFHGRTVSFGFGFQAYIVRIKDNNSLQLEDMSLSNLQSVSKTFLPATVYNLKIDTTGNILRARAWKDGDAEPSTWDIDYTDTSVGGGARYTSGAIGFSAENVSPTYYDDVSITNKQNLSNWMGLMYQYIIDNPTLFMNGDIWAPFPERTEGIFSDSTSFLPHSSPGIQTNFANFFNNVISVSRYAFNQIGVPGVVVGYTANNYSEIRSGWIPQTVFDTAQTVSADYYQNYNGNGFGADTLQQDLQTISQSKGYKVFHQEWGATPEIISATSTQNHETRENNLFRPILNTEVTEFQAGRLEGFNYWGFWDTGETDSGIAKISGSTATLANIKIRREGWVVSEYFNAGPTPTVTFTSRAYVLKNQTQTFTARAFVRIVTNTTTATFTARARVRIVIGPFGPATAEWDELSDPNTIWRELEDSFLIINQ